MSDGGGVGLFLVLLVGGFVAIIAVIVVGFVLFARAMGRSADQATPAGLAERARGLVPWDPRAFGDFAADPGPSWSRMLGTLRVTGVVPSRSRPGAAWAAFFVARASSGATGEAELRTSRHLVRLVADGRAFHVTLDGRPLGAIDMTHGLLWGASGQEGRVVALGQDQGGYAFAGFGLGVQSAATRGPRALFLGSTRVAVVAADGVPTVTVEAALTAEAEAWLLAVCLLELAWSITPGRVLV